MIEVVQNPAGIDETYLDSLNHCFAGVWSARSYAWYFHRPFGTRHPDKMGLYDDGRLVAGIGINYRRLAIPGGPVQDVGILTAAWTLPRHRGRWHLAKLVDASMRVARERGCIALLSFVTAENASAAILRRKGAVALTTRYLFLSPNEPLKLPKALPQPQIVCADQLAVGIEESSAITFHYASEQEWRWQFLDRPSPTTVYEMHSHIAVIEHVGSTDRLQFLSKAQANSPAPLLAMAQRARQRNRSVFHFTMSKSLAQEAANHGFGVGKGYAMIIDLDTAPAVNSNVVNALHATPWEIQAGDRM